MGYLSTLDWCLFSKITRVAFGAPLALHTHRLAIRKPTWLMDQMLDNSLVRKRMKGEKGWDLVSLQTPHPQTNDAYAFVKDQEENMHVREGTLVGESVTSYRNF